MRTDTPQHQIESERLLDAWNGHVHTYNTLRSGESKITVSIPLEKISGIGALESEVYHFSGSDGREYYAKSKFTPGSAAVEATAMSILANDERTRDKVVYFSLARVQGTQGAEGCNYSPVRAHGVVPKNDSDVVLVTEKLGENIKTVELKRRLQEVVKTVLPIMIVCWENRFVLKDVKHDNFRLDGEDCFRIFDLGLNERFDVQSELDKEATEAMLLVTRNILTNTLEKSLKGVNERWPLKPRGALLSFDYMALSIQHEPPDIVAEKIATYCSNLSKLEALPVSKRAEYYLGIDQMIKSGGEVSFFALASLIDSESDEKTKEALYRKYYTQLTAWYTSLPQVRSVIEGKILPEDQLPIEELRALRKSSLEGPGKSIPVAILLYSRYLERFDPEESPSWEDEIRQTLGFFDVAKTPGNTPERMRWRIFYSHFGHNGKFDLTIEQARQVQYEFDGQKLVLDGKVITV